LPQLVLLLYSDPADPVAAAIMRNAQRFPVPLLAMSLGEMLDVAVVDDSWTWHGRTLAPAQTAVVNRLTSFGSGSIAERLSQPFQQQRLWTWLHAAVAVVRLCVVDARAKLDARRLRIAARSMAGRSRARSRLAGARPPHALAPAAAPG
jgi:hypothetical protein